MAATSMTVGATVENIAGGTGWVSEADLSWNSKRHNEVTAADTRTQEQQDLRTWGAMIHLLSRRMSVRVCDWCVCVILKGTSTVAFHSTDLLPI